MDIFLHHCIELCRDLLPNRLILIAWVPCELNARCDALAHLACKIDLGACLLLSRGEELSGGRERPSALADAFEAVVGAVFMDSGYERTRVFVLDCFKDHLGELQILPNLENPKGELQEYLQIQSNRPPHYELVRVTGPDHDRFFECAVHHDQQELGRGSGKSKKEAEFNAALQALDNIKHKMDPSENDAT